MRAKGAAERSDSGKRMLRKMLVGEPAPFGAEGRLSDGGNSEAKHTELTWEADSSEFRRKTAHLRLRDPRHRPKMKRKSSRVSRTKGAEGSITWFDG